MALEQVTRRWGSQDRVSRRSPEMRDPYLFMSPSGFGGGRKPQKPGEALAAPVSILLYLPVSLPGPRSPFIQLLMSLQDLGMGMDQELEPSQVRPWGSGNMRVSAGGGVDVGA
jgi:hypothetical protein